MKVLAIEKEIEGALWENSDDLLKLEAQHVFHLYLSGSLREIYFTESKNAVVVLETKDRETAEGLLDSLPLVKAGKIKFEILELMPYTGYERIVNK